MPNYRRVWVPGGTYFFTVNLLERRRRLLVEHIDALRASFADARMVRPFDVLAIVVLPDHLHCVWRLPVAIPITPTAGNASKPGSRGGCPRTNTCRRSAGPVASVASGNGVTGNT